MLAGLFGAGQRGAAGTGAVRNGRAVRGRPLAPNRTIDHSSPMKSGTAATLIFSVIVIVVIFIYAMDSAGACRLALVVQAISTKSAAGCFEFWFDRYQTLLGGLFTIVAAGIAGWFVLQQIKEARKQTSIMLGDINPDFILRAPRPSPGRKEDFKLLIVNQNRRPIEVLSIEVINPADIIAAVDPSDAVSVIGAEQPRKVLVKILVPGTRPSAPLASAVTVTGAFSVNSDKPVGSVENLVMKIEYEMVGDAPTREAVIRCLPTAPISGHYTESPGGGFSATISR